MAADHQASCFYRFPRRRTPLREGKEWFDMYLEADE